MSEPTSNGQDVVPSITRRHPDALCENCSLFTEQGSKYAGGEGPDTADIVIIGEAPGYDEAKKGRPFTGPSGRLLDTVLSYHKIDRAASYVDNVVACRPPSNRTPSKGEIDCCWPRLRKEVTKRQPKTIVALGNTAAQTTLETRTGITTLRIGPPKPSPYFEGAEVIATVHPAYCLRTADAFPHLVSDIGKARTDIRISWEPPTYVVVNDESSARQALEEIPRRSKRLVVDIEAGIDKDEFGHPDHYQPLCVGIGYEKGKVCVIGEEALRVPSVKHHLADVLLTSDLTEQNGKFDSAGLEAWCQTGGIGSRLKFDTMLASYCLDERPGIHSLDYNGVELLGAPNWKHELSRYVKKGDNYNVVPRDVLYRYNAYDVGATDLLEEYFVARFDDDNRKLHDFLVEVSPILQACEVEGVSIDIPYLDELTETYLGVIEALVDELQPWVANPRSPQQVKAALASMGVTVSSTAKDILEIVLEKVQPETQVAEFVRRMLRHRREQKLYGTYIKGARKRLYQGRLHPTFLLHGTTTGRTACRNPNLQNVPRESSIRRMFIPGPGNVFVQADYRTIELRALATEAGDEYLRTIFLEGRDIHDEFSSVLYGPNFTKEQRVRTKAFVYGVSYGREEYSIAMEYGIPVAEARRTMQLFTNAIPQTMTYREGVKHKVLKEQDDLVTHFGRHRRFWLITEENKKDVVKEALAFVPQSTASDINLHSLVRLRRDYGLKTRIPVHDSILVECAKEEADEVGETMRTVMEQTATEIYTDFVPFPVDVKVGTSWGEV